MKKCGREFLTMAEYIDRAEYCEKHCRCSNEYCDRESCPIWKAPAADVAPVVRCKDCKHYDMGVCLKIYSDGNAHPEAWQSRRSEDFCSYGERKDGGERNG